MNLPPHHRKWQKRIIALPGSIVVFFICLLALASCSVGSFGSAPVATPVPTAPVVTPTPGEAHAVMLRYIQMHDEQNGWAVTSDNKILHSGSGSTQWLDVTPEIGWAPPFQVGTGVFLDAQHAWVPVQGNGRYSVFYTNDGGNLWLQEPILDHAQGQGQHDGIGQITFSDINNGWLLFTTSSTASQLAVDVFATTDGGTTWLDVANQSKQPRQPGQTSDLLLGNGSVAPAIHFINAYTGWVTGTNLEDHPAALLATQDGGATWKSQALPRPNNGADVPGASLAPTFFGTQSQDGILPVVTKSGTSNSALSIYVTHNGGEDWTTTAATADLTPETVFLQTQQGWAVTSNSGIAATNDGGQHWTGLVDRLAPDVTAISTLNFVSAKNGWAVATLSTHANALFQTIDGGKSWTPVNTTAASNH